VVVLFGGKQGTTFLSDTWEWDGNNWLQLNPANSPPPRNAHVLAYDPARGRTVLFGGNTPYPGPILADTWEWDGLDWVQRFPLTSPPPRDLHALACDSARGKLVLFGGHGASVSGHLSDTWEYGPTDPASYVTFGSGCAGSAGTPALVASRPWSGETFTLDVTDLPATTVSLVLLGVSKTSWGPLPLPLPLDLVGMPGCVLFVSNDLAFVVPSAGGRATWSVPGPGGRDLIGGRFYNQAFVFDPVANPLGATSSNAGEGKFGAK
jgi:hypothetical protein